MGAGNIEPQFAGNLALSEGMNWVRDSAGNREWVIPLHLEAASADALTELVRDIRSDLFKGAQVEFKLEGSTQSTFFDLERGRLDEQFEYFIVAHNSLRATLRLWTRPYGHTGTVRLLASFRQASRLSGSSTFQIPATAVSGDVDALANLRLLPAIGLPAGETPWTTMWGIARSASYQSLWPTASLGGGIGFGANSTQRTASNAVASLYREFAIDTSNVDDPIQVHFSPNVAAAHVGKNRVFAIVRSRFWPATALTVFGYDETRQATMNGVLATQTASGQWQVADLGEWDIGAFPTGGSPSQTFVPTTSLEIRTKVASGASFLASYAFHIQAMVLLPLGVAAGRYIQHDAVVLINDGAELDIEAVPHHQVKVNANTQLVDAQPGYAGDTPHIPPDASTSAGGASGPRQLIVFGGNMNAWSALRAAHGVQLYVQERFQFLR